VQGHEQAMDVEDGQGVQQDVVRREAPGLVQGQGVGRQGAVGEHGALGPARGSAGVDDGGQVVRRAGLDLQLRRKIRGARQEGLGVAQEEGRLGVPQEVVHLALGVGGVEGQEDRTDLQGGQVDHHGLDRLLHLQGHAIAGGDAPRPEARRRPGRKDLKLAIGHRRRSWRTEGVAGGVRRKSPGEKAIEVPGHGSSLPTSASRRGSMLLRALPAPRAALGNARIQPPLRKPPHPAARGAPP